MKILTARRKFFLLAWIPIMILVTIQINDRIGQDVWLHVAELNEEGLEIGSYWKHGVFGVEDAITMFLFLLTITIFLFFIVDLNDKPISNEKLRSKLANIFMFSLWILGLSVLVVTLYLAAIH